MTVLQAPQMKLNCYNDDTKAFLHVNRDGSVSFKIAQAPDSLNDEPSSIALCLDETSKCLENWRLRASVAL
jgi:hypothetical protein